MSSRIPNYYSPNSEFYDTSSLEGELRQLFKALDLVNVDFKCVIGVLGIDSQRGFYGDQGTREMAKVKNHTKMGFF